MAELEIASRYTGNYGAPVVKPGMPRLYNFLTDMREDYDLVKFGGRDGGEQHYWVLPVIFKQIVAHQRSLAEEPRSKWERLIRTCPQNASWLAAICNGS